MRKTGSASGKIILSGEYAVVFGKRGIAVPSTEKMTVTFESDETADGVTILWNDGDPVALWFAYAEKILTALEAKTGKLKGTLTIENDLPLGKGMGSSTALVVAIARCLLGPDCRAVADATEKEMNPNGSGIDFAVIWEEKPILFEKGKPPSLIDLDLSFLKTAKLIDTGMPNQATTELVTWVRSRETELKDPLEVIGNCTERILKGEDLKTVMRDHAKAQIALGVVPENAQKIIKEVERGGGAAKVIGAGGRTGGGGMVLAIA